MRKIHTYIISILTAIFQMNLNEATGYASQHYSMPVPSQDKLGEGVAAERTFGIKMGDDKRRGHRQSGWGGVQMDCQLACLCYLSLQHKIQKMTSYNGVS